MTDRRRKWSLVCIAGLFAADVYVSYFVIGGEHAGGVFLISLFLGTVAIGYLFLTKDDGEDPDRLPDIYDDKNIS